MEINRAIQELVACYSVPKNQNIQIPRDVVKTVCQIFNDRALKPTLTKEERDIIQSLNPEERAAVDRLRDAYKALAGDLLKHILSFIGGVPSIVNKEFQAQEEPVYKQRLQKIKEDPFLSQFIPENFQQNPPTGLSQIRECIKETERLRQESLDTSLIKMCSRTDWWRQRFPIALVDSSKEIAQNIRTYLKDNPSSCEQVLNLRVWRKSLKEISPEIALFKNLKIVEFCVNSISFLPPEMQSLTELTKLNLSENPLDKLPSWITSFEKLKKLTVLKCPLRYLPLGTNESSQLTEFELSHAKFIQIPEGIFSLVNLKKLLITDTPIESISSEISQLKNLETLVLSRNRLSSLPVPELRGLLSLQHLSIEKNRLRSNVLAVIHSEFGEESLRFNLNNKNYILHGSTIEQQNFQ